MNIDVDSHFFPLDLFNGLPSEIKNLLQIRVDASGNSVFNYPNLEPTTVLTVVTEEALKLRIDVMREAGFDKQCLLVLNSSIPDPYISNEIAVHMCRAWNSSVAKIAEKHDSFVGISQVPHAEVESAVEEAERAVNELGFRAIEMRGRWGGGKNMESRDWWPFFETVNKLGVPLWFHASGMLYGHRLNPWMPGNDLLSNFPPYINSLFGFLIHAEFVCAGLIFGGVLDKFPNLRVAITESDAGWVPGFMEWLDTIYDSQLMVDRQGAFLDRWKTNPSIGKIQLRKRPSQYVRDNFCFTVTSTSDTAIGKLVPFLVNEMGLENNLLIESDYNHVEGSLDIVRRIRTLESISGEAKNKICGKNAADLLKIKWQPSEFAELYA
jgi:predicted TIM-barrel fold metal-dependent hydrolase